MATSTTKTPEFKSSKFVGYNKMAPSDAEDEALWKKLRGYLDRTSKKHESIVDCSNLMRQKCQHNVARCVSVWLQEFKKNPHRQLLYLYVANDVMQKDREGSFIEKFHQVMGFCLYRFSKSNGQYFDKAKRMIGLWERRNVLSLPDTLKLRHALAGRDAEVVQTVEAREDFVPGAERASELAGTVTTTGSGVGTGGMMAHDDANLDVFAKEASLDWNGAESLEEVKDAIDEAQGYLSGVVSPKGKAKEKREDAVSKARSERTQKFSKLMAVLDLSQSKSIQDDLVGEKMARDKEIFLTIQANQGKEESHALKAYKDGDVKEETEYYRVKVIEEKFELDLGAFKDLIADYKRRIEEAFVSWEKEMELVEETYQVAESELSDLKGVYSQFREDCKLVARVNRLVSKQAKERKRKREVETKQRDDEAKRKLELERESQMASQAFFQNLGSRNEANPTSYPPQPQAQPQPQSHQQPQNLAYSYGAYNANAAVTSGYSYQPYTSTSTYAQMPATSPTPTQSPYQQQPGVQQSSPGSGQVAPNQYGQQHQPTYSQYSQGYNSYSNRNSSNERRQ